MLGVGRLAYSLGTHRQIPSIVSRLDDRYGTPYVAIAIAALGAFALASSTDMTFMAGLFAFGATLAFTLAHLAIIVLRFREPDLRRPFRIPLSIAPCSAPAVSTTRSLSAATVLSLPYGKPNV